MFNPFTGELRCGSSIYRLRPQPSLVLRCLAERSGEVVSRGELHRLLWGDAVHVNFDQGLNSCMKQIRRALGDSRHASRFVETLPRRGYRFLVPVGRRDSVDDVPSRVADPGDAITALAAAIAQEIALRLRAILAEGTGAP